MQIESRQLCYIKGDKAYFTSCFEKQWGDDWNDTPYEHNAGAPYTGDYDLTIVYFEVDAFRPCDNYMNTPYSVRDINKGAVPWLKDGDVSIYGGATLLEFIEYIEGLEGAVYSTAEDLKELELAKSSKS